jgi:hypothetical protein
MKTLLCVFVALLSVLVGVARADELLYGFDDDTLDGWYMRTNAGSVPPEEAPILGTNAPAQGAGYVSLGIQSNKYYTLVRTPDGFQNLVQWEDYDRIAVDVRLDNPQGWNSFNLLCRSSANWGYTITGGQILEHQSNAWVTFRGPITPALTNYLYSADWVYFECAINQALTNATRVDIDNIRLESDTDLLNAGIALYPFDTTTLDGWSGTKRGALAWDSVEKVQGAGSMLVDVTNSIGNWANVAARNNAHEDAAWDLNSNLVAWIRASGSVWSNYLRPYIVFGVTFAATSHTYELNANGGAGYVSLDDAWHPYIYTYDPIWITNALAVNLTLSVTTAGEPTGKYFHIDNIRLLPGIIPEPGMLALVGTLAVLGLSIRRRVP